MDGIQTTKNGKQVLTIFFDCRTKEESSAFPKMEIVAELTLDSGKLEKIHHINTNDIKCALEKAVLNAVWFENTKGKDNA